ncbi:hypothetical protein ACFVWY_05755 [Streptomyces sp. NPDC058195]|uniref:hypothetical protein n=1 Tax=Streptomyces sp. NPDC058195 TaxID=3346375 RepID=UPI0036EE24AA
MPEPACETRRGGRPEKHVTTAVGLGDIDAHHSSASLADSGNPGGASVLDILARTHTAPPHDGAQGPLVAFGPGFTTAAVRGTWSR